MVGVDVQDERGWVRHRRFDRHQLRLRRHHGHLQTRPHLRPSGPGNGARIFDPGFGEPGKTVLSWPVRIRMAMVYTGVFICGPRKYSRPLYSRSSPWFFVGHKLKVVFLDIRYSVHSKIITGDSDKLVGWSVQTKPRKNRLFQNHLICFFYFSEWCNLFAYRLYASLS